MKLLDQNAVPGRIVDDVLRGVVLARDVVAVDIARAVGVPDGLAGYGPHGVESELIERAVGVTRRKLRDVAGPVVVSAGNRAVDVDHLPEGEIAIGQEAFEQRRDAAG